MNLRLFARREPEYRSVVFQFPTLAPVAQATKRANWPVLRQLFDNLDPTFDPTWVVVAATEVEGSERFFADLVDSERDSTLPRLLLGGRHIKLAWKARTAHRARNVSPQQFAVFGDHLTTAERLLASVTSDEPGNVAAWSSRITVSRGLQFGHAESRRRYAMAAQAFPNPLYAQRQLLQCLCPKWGGSSADVHAFARECADAAPDGSVNAALIAEGHIEDVLESTSPYRLMSLRSDPVREELLRAAERSAGHPDFRPQPGSVWAHSVFEFAFHHSGDHPLALEHFAANGPLFDAPWTRYPEPVEARVAAWHYCQAQVGR